MITPRSPGYDRDCVIQAVAAFVMALCDGGALAEDVVAGLEAAARCEPLLRQRAAKLDGMLEQITPENLHPPVDP